MLFKLYVVRRGLRIYSYIKFLLNINIHARGVTCQLDDLDILSIINSCLPNQLMRSLHAFLDFFGHLNSFLELLFMLAQCFNQFGQESPSYGIMAKAQNCGLEVSEFELQPRYNVHFQTDMRGKGIDLFIPNPN